MSDAYFSDAEVDEMCEGLTQDAAKIRFLRRLGLKVDRKPNGRPLAWRPAAAAPATGQDQNREPEGFNIVGLQSWAAALRDDGTATGGTGQVVLQLQP